MDVLALVHGEDARSGVFGETIRAAGHRLDERSYVRDRPRAEGYDAVVVFGGSMHPDQDAVHPWLADEVDVLRRLLERGTPVLGVCLGSQLLARAAGGEVGPAVETEIGWYDVEVLDADDPLLGPLAPGFPAFQWHHYAFRPPPGAPELARSAAGSQAFRAGERAWGIQFHPEVSAEQVEQWLADPADPAPDPERVRAETATRIESWNALGRALCLRFLALCG
jgi:GMP synthase (glutamine-hydrolysing)